MYGKWQMTKGNKDKKTDGSRMLPFSGIGFGVGFGLGCGTGIGLGIGGLGKQ